MAYYLQAAFFIIAYLVMDYRMKDRDLRKWFGLFFFSVGIIMVFTVPVLIVYLYTPILSVSPLLMGLGLLISRNKYGRPRPETPIHPLLRAPTMNLAPDFPDDPVMHQLMQLLHEEVGLPKHKTISLNTSINLDLGCEGSEARQLMDALEQDFGIDLNDYDAYRYFQPVGFDVYLKRRAKGRGEKAPLTIGMLYQAAKMQRWETAVLEQ